MTKLQDLGEQGYPNLTTKMTLEAMASAPARKAWATSAIAKRLGSHRTTANRALKWLRDEGLVERVKVVNREWTHRITEFGIEFAAANAPSLILPDPPKAKVEPAVDPPLRSPQSPVLDISPEPPAKTTISLMLEGLIRVAVVEALDPVTYPDGDEVLAALILAHKWQATKAL